MDPTDHAEKRLHPLPQYIHDENNELRQGTEEKILSEDRDVFPSLAATNTSRDIMEYVFTASNDDPNVQFWWTDREGQERRAQPSDQLDKLNCRLFCRDVPQDLKNVGTKDLASKNTKDLVMAQQKGQNQLDTFANERLLPNAKTMVTFCDTLPEKKTLTFASLYETSQKWCTQ